MRIFAKYLLIIFALLLAVPVASARDFIIVVDAGHGGHDGGAPGRTSKEKTIDLAVAKLVGKKLQKLKNVKVIYTRTSDEFISLMDRCRIANNAGADLFVSIHADAADGRPEVQGATVYYPDSKLSGAPTGKSSRRQDDNEVQSGQPLADPSSRDAISRSTRCAASIMSELRSTASRSSRGTKPGNYAVLRYTTMPAVLVELDFISNPDQEIYLNSKDGQEALATAIANGVGQYVKRANSSKGNEGASKPETPGRKGGKKGSGSSTSSTTGSRTSNPPAGQDLYKVQFLTSDTKLSPNDKRFKGLSPVDFYKEGRIYKYTYGSTTSISEAKKIFAEVRKLFPDAFIITVRDGVRVK